MYPNVLLVALKGACTDGVLDDGEPFTEKGAGAAVGGQGLAFGTSLQHRTTSTDKGCSLSFRGIFAIL
jgi:hypothetical protein